MPADYAMLEFSEKLTLTPSMMAEQDVEGLRAHGFTDREILSIILAAAYRNYIVRVADALGVELNATVDYAPELIRAFGVDDQQARTTLYADRLTRTTPLREAGERPPLPSMPQVSANQICWIDTTRPPEMTEQFRHASEELVKLSAPTPHRYLAQAFALRPDALAVTVEYLRLVDLDGSGLGRRLETMIGLIVAATLSSQYMAVHHAQRLLHNGATTEEVASLVHYSGGSGLDPREGELIHFCEQLTRVPGTMVRSDVEALRAVGFSNRDIITIAASASLENFLCRVANGVGLRLEPEMSTSVALETLGSSAAAP